MLASAQPQEQKGMLGEHLFQLIKSMVPDLARKLTDMFIELNNSELIHMLENRESLKAKVDETVTILRDEMKMFEERLFPLIQAIIPDNRPDLVLKITDMFIYLDKSELLHMLEHHEFFKAKVDETVAILKQKQMFGDRLEPLIESMVPDELVNKIIGMLIDLDNPKLLQMLENHEFLKAKVDEGVAMLKVHLVCMVLYIGDTKYL